MFADKDHQQFKQKNIDKETIQWQLDQFNKGVKAVNLARHAGINDGILRPQNTSAYLNNFNEHQCKVTKFVPASGAASRMFKALFTAMHDINNGKAEEEVLTADDLVSVFYASLKKFAFYAELKSVLDKQNMAVNLKNILNTVLSDNFMAYGSLPKGLLAFHLYENGPRTPFEEHLVEGALYGKDNDGNVYLHFTVSPEHQPRFEELLGKVKENYQQRFKVKYHIEFSVQSPSTDTMSVNLQNGPFRNDDGSIVFRPGGHGALIDNLNQIDADIIFVKNIDNVVPEHLINDTVEYKKILAGVLIELQNEIFKFQEAIEKGHTSSLKDEILAFYKDKLFVDYKFYISEVSKNKEQEFLSGLLNRPIRVCGVVKNVGEPGGGPFWVKDQKGNLSLQIVESSQVDSTNQSQNTIFKKSTHFNPVDLVCAVKNYKGIKYNLHDFVDRQTCFISKKSKDGKDLKALELPGLWNGAMAFWNTLFVEVPISTFNPVKTVNDLLRKQHQNTL